MKSALRTSAPRSIILVRILVGWVFLSEGIQKLIFPATLGAGRFAKIGIPVPQVTGPFVGVVEIVCGSLLLVGFLIRLACVPLLIDIAIAIISTKIPILLGHGFWGFSTPKGPYGVWGMLHEARTDFSMALGLVFLLIVGAGQASIDALVSQPKPQAPEEPHS